MDRWIDALGQRYNEFYGLSITSLTCSLIYPSHRTKGEALTLASEIAASITAESPDVEVALFVPYVFIEACMEVVGDKLTIGAEVS
jgi:hypothetical protein